MKTILKISIEIEKEFTTGLKGSFNVTDMIFSDYSKILTSEELIRNTKTALKKLEGFTMLTISFTMNEYNNSQEKTQQTVRYVNKYGEEITRSLFNGEKYYNFLPSDKKIIFKDINMLVNILNEKYIEIVRAETVNS